MKAGYWLADKYAELVDTVRRAAPGGLDEAWGVVHYAGGPDFRLNLGRYRVIGIFPLASELALLLEIDKVLRRRGLYAADPDLDRLEDAFGYLEITHKNRLWTIGPHTDLQDPYVDRFLACGMRLLVKEILRRHPQAAADRSIEEE